MDFFSPCWIALAGMFTSAPSKTYLAKQITSFPERISVCNRVAERARERGIDPFLAISISFHETKFTYTDSNKGAKGPLGVLPKWHCPKKGKCDLIDAGIDAIEKVLEIYPDDMCMALATYNRGFYGKCEKGRTEYIYAQNVMNLYSILCASTDLCHTC